VAAGGVVALAAVGIALLAWGVFTTGSPRSDAQDAGAAVSNTPFACEPARAGESTRELGEAPIFWRFGLSQDYLTSGQLCDRNLKIVFRVTEPTSCVAGFPSVQQFPDVVQAGNVDTGEHLSAPVTCVTCPGAACPGVDLPGVYLVTGFELPSAGEWRLQVRFDSDFSTQTVRIGGPDVPALAGGPRPPCAPPQPAGGGPAMAAVIVDRATGDCRIIPTADRIMQAQWVEDGKTFVAYDTDLKSFVIFDIDGTALQPIDLKTPEDGTIGGAVAPAPAGRTILVDREIPSAGIYSFLVRDVATGQDHDFPQPPGVNGQPSFSPDGKHAAYINTNNGRQSLVIATTPVTDGRYVLVQNTAGTGASDIEPLSWSSDGNYLLVTTGTLPPSCGPAPNTSCPPFGSLRFEVFAAGASAGTAPVFSTGHLVAAPGNAAAWVGARRLALSEVERTDEHGTPSPARGLLIDIPGGAAAPGSLNSALRAFVSNPARSPLGSISPDGEFSVNGNQLVSLSTSATVQVLAYPASYMADWTADSSEVVLSFGGN
jgi:hypothetical protein